MNIHVNSVHCSEWYMTVYQILNIYLGYLLCGETENTSSKILLTTGYHVKKLGAQV